MLSGRKQKLLCLPILVFFTLMVGSVSAWRALFMAALVLLAPVVHRDSDAITSLGFALGAILLFTPYAICSVSLQLSFGAMLGLTVVGPHLNGLAAWSLRQLPPRYKKLKGILRRVLSVVAMSLSASVFTIPLSAWYFRQVSLISLLANLLVTWLLSFLLGLGLLSVLAGLCIPVLGELLAFPAGWLAKFIVTLVYGMGNLSFAAISLSSPYLLAWFIGAILLILLAAGMVLKKQFPILPMCSLVLTLCLCLLLNRWSADRTDLIVKILDAGQGQCILLLSQGRAAAIDCGGNAYDSAGDLLADELQELGYSKLDLLVCTHLDSDHINGGEELFARIQVDRVYYPETEEASQWKEALLTLCREQETEAIPVSETQLLRIGRTTAEIYPPMNPAEDNNSSLASLWETERFSLLITGDMDWVGERMLLAHEALPKVDLLVAGHHGSKTSTSEALLEAVQPEVAMISVGENSYGHPAEETLLRLAERDIAIYRTDSNGTITVSVRGED